MGKCMFKAIWTMEYDFLTHVPGDKYAAICKCCRKTFCIKNGGVGHVQSHAKSKDRKVQYKRWIQNRESSNTFFSFKSSTEEMPPIEAPVIPPSTSSVLPVLSNDVLKAEILWCLKKVDSNYSDNLMDDTALLFKVMFYDSQIAQQFSLQKTKTSYMLRFGLAL